MLSRFVFLVVLIVSLSGCDSQDYIPKPRGYARVDFPEHSYARLRNESCAFSFDKSDLALYETVKAPVGESCWFNIVYPNQKAKVHFSYLSVTPENLNEYIEDARKLALKHLVKADDFEENVVLDDSAQVYGVIYDFKGSTASNLQFYLTDSVNHFIRGSLYFEVTPNADSLAPSEMYIEEEVLHLINTFTWQ
jgi:gliding motility-associated lipoprotein GldD